jgi:hypothetical protein
LNIEENSIEEIQNKENVSFSFINYFKNTASLIISPKKAINRIIATPISIKSFFLLIVLFGSLRFVGEYFYWFLIIEGGTPNLTNLINFIAGWTQISIFFLLGVLFSITFLLDFLSAKVTKSKYRFKTLISIFSHILLFYSIVPIIDIFLESVGISTFHHYPKIIIESLIIDLSSVYITIGQIFMAIMLSYLTFISILVLYKKVANAILATLVSGIFFNLIMASQILLGNVNDYILIHTMSIVGDEFHWLSLWMLDNIYFILLMVPFYLIYLFEIKRSLKLKLSSFLILDFGIFLALLAIGYVIAGKQLNIVEIVIFIFIAFLICLNASLNRKWWNKENSLSKNEYYLLIFFIVSLSVCLAGLISFFSVLLTLILNLYLIISSNYNIKIKQENVKRILHSIIKYSSFLFLVAVEITPFNKTTEFPFSFPSETTDLWALGVILCIFFISLVSKNISKSMK